MKKIVLHCLRAAELAIARLVFDEDKKKAWISTIANIIIEIQTVEEEEE